MSNHWTKTPLVLTQIEQVNQLNILLSLFGTIKTPESFNIIMSTKL